MIELADALDRLLQLLIFVEPATNLGDPFVTYAELLRAAAGVCHGEHEHLVPFAARAFRTAFGMSDGALQLRTAQQLAGGRQLANELVARFNGSLTNDS
ncbi:hypothetical protein IVA87_31425 [Bradyrhizobium sp. 147]|uniref:hypothetical protein n=1 Tax=unclassified Bradyrhizobium TaxID=2631580 RepID=UPI001FF7D245|nr:MULTISPECIES: hypothetical protein [unclassified Bradyrhizobium]MCK1623182.1 hypothetical protein [Bradyrhizobium sp. 160]MCK1683783.1 hypothetical protein [Bradyrhizobium sp. 147]